MEKYLKAFLLLNGRTSKKNSSGKDFSHDTELLYREVKGYAGDLLPDTLVFPEGYKSENWIDTPMDEFVQGFYSQGQPNNRYGLYGYRATLDDLIKFDQCVYLFRLIARNLDAYPFVGDPDPSSTLPKTMRELLLEVGPNHNYSKLKILEESKATSDVKAAGFNYNFYFAPSGYAHNIELLKHTRRVKNSPVNCGLSDGPEGEIEEELTRWLTDNMVLSKDDKNYLMQQFGLQ